MKSFNHFYVCFLFSYENDPDLFMFDYRDDLENRAKERERVFTLNKFVEPDEDDPKTLMLFENKQRANKLLKNFKEEDEVDEIDMAGTMKSNATVGDKD